MKIQDIYDESQTPYKDSFIFIDKDNKIWNIVNCQETVEDFLLEMPDEEIAKFKSFGKERFSQRTHNL